MQRSTHESILFGLLVHTGEEGILKFMEKTSMSAEEEISFYALAHSLDYKRVLKNLLRSHALKKRFSYLGESFQKFIQEERFDLLVLPTFFAYELNFKALVQKFTGTAYNVRVLKDYGTMTTRSGNFLNNVYMMSEIYGSKGFNPHDLLKLDHSQLLKRHLVMDTWSCRELLSSYGPSRLFKILTTWNENTYRELSTICTALKTFEPEIKSRMIPKKPRDFNHLLDEIRNSYVQYLDKGIVFENNLQYLQDRRVKDYSIDVPKTSRDLATISQSFRNCAYTYVENIQKGENFILTLKKDDVAEVCVEVRKRNNGVFITQIKGRKNSLIDYDDEETFREILIDLICKHDPARTDFVSSDIHT